MLPARARVEYERQRSRDRQSFDSPEQRGERHQGLLVFLGIGVFFNQAPGVLEEFQLIVFIQNSLFYANFVFYMT
jgi:hypothetical protein